MAPLGALSQAWTSAEASLPLGSSRGLYPSMTYGSAWRKAPSLTTTPAARPVCGAGVATAQRPAAGAARADYRMSLPKVALALLTGFVAFVLLAPASGTDSLPQREVAE